MDTENDNTVGGLNRTAQALGRLASEFRTGAECNGCPAVPDRVSEHAAGRRWHTEAEMIQKLDGRGPPLRLGTAHGAISVVDIVGRIPQSQ